MASEPQSVLDPADYDGQLAISRTSGAGDFFTIHRADPRVMIRVSWVEEACRVLGRAPEGAVQLDGDVLRIFGDNQTVIYRLVAQVTVPGEEEDERVFLAEWPD
jgi:hypothetical protein